MTKTPKRGNGPTKSMNQAAAKKLRDQQETPKANQAESAQEMPEEAEGLTGSAEENVAEVKDTPPPGAEAAGRDKMAIVGSAVWLMSRLETHKHVFIGDIEWAVVPPISLNQYRIWYRGKIPVAYASWAFVSDDVQTRIEAGQPKLAPKDWKSGPHAWLMDLVVPFGGTEAVVAEVSQNLVPGIRVSKKSQQRRNSK